jgi:hypothetical protein
MAPHDLNAALALLQASLQSELDRILATGWRTTDELLSQLALPPSAGDAARVLVESELVNHPERYQWSRDDTGRVVWRLKGDSDDRIGGAPVPSRPKRPLLSGGAAAAAPEPDPAPSVEAVAAAALAILDRRRDAQGDHVYH